MIETQPAVLIEVAIKDVDRLAKSIGVDSTPACDGILFPTVVISESICVKQGFVYFKAAYLAAQEKFRQWRKENPDVAVFLRARCLPIEDCVTLEICLYSNQTYEQKTTILQDTGLRGRQIEPNQIQLPGGKSDRRDGEVRDPDPRGRDAIPPVHHSGNMNPTVYLAGPITGCSYEGCTDWRNAVSLKLAQYNIRGLSPMRAKDYLKSEKKITGSYEDKVMSCARGITTRDRFDCMRCDVLLVNFLGSNKVSIGTVMEIAWADSQRIPIICVIDEPISAGEPAPNVHDHPMIRECIGFRVATLDEAVEVAIKILGTGYVQEVPGGQMIQTPNGTASQLDRSFPVGGRFVD